MDQEVHELDLCIGSLDVKALYPSLDIPKCGQICRERVMVSEVEFCGVEYRWATHYLALALSEKGVILQELSHLVPRSRFVNGPKPGSKRILDDPCGDGWKWYKQPDDFSRQEKRTVMAHLVQAIVLCSTTGMGK